MVTHQNAAPRKPQLVASWVFTGPSSVAEIRQGGLSCTRCSAVTFMSLCLILQQYFTLQKKGGSCVWWPWVVFVHSPSFYLLLLASSSP